MKSNQRAHNLRYDIEDIFRIERNGEHARFNDPLNAVKAARSDRRLLWHGSPTTNFAGILTQGLKVAPREASANGLMFGTNFFLRLHHRCWANCGLQARVSILLMHPPSRPTIVPLP